MQLLLMYDNNLHNYINNKTNTQNANDLKVKN